MNLKGLIIKQRLFEEFFPGRANAVNKAYNVSMLALIALNVIAVILETEESPFQSYQIYFDLFEYLSVFEFHR